MAYEHISDTRYVQKSLPDNCISFTPKGRVPLRCTTVELSYDIPTGRIRSVTVHGYLVDQRDVDRRARTLRGYGKERANNIVRRSYDVDWETREVNVPSWLAELIEQYRPTTTEEK